MKEKNDFALVRRPSSAVERVEPGAKRILAGLVADTLALAKKEPPAKPVFRVLMGIGEGTMYEGAFKMFFAFKLSQKYDLKCIQFYDAGGLLRLVQEEPFDLIFVVLNNITWEKRFDGNHESYESYLIEKVELLARLKARSSKPVIVCTPYVSDFVSLAQRLQQTGIPYCSSPFTMEDFWSALRVCLPQKQLSSLPNTA